jgi:Na+-driven multidrug efflux pump
MLLGAVLNIILDAVFIFVFNWGVQGAAWATVISQFASTVFILRFILRKKAIVRLNFSMLKPNILSVRQIMAFGSAQALLQMLMAMVQLINNKSAGWYGALALGVANGDAVVLSGMRIIGSILMLILMPVFGINQGAQPILGYNYGAKLYRRVLRAYIGAISAATLICTVGFIIVQLFPVQLVLLFTPENNADPDFYNALLHFTPYAMRIMMMLLPLGGFLIVSTNFFVVTGRPKISIFLSVLRQCIILIPCIIIFGKFWGLWGVITAAPIADGLSFIVTAALIFFELKKLRKNLSMEVCAYKIYEKDAILYVSFSYVS